MATISYPETYMAKSEEERQKALLELVPAQAALSHLHSFFSDAVRDEEQADGRFFIHVQSETLTLSARNAKSEAARDLGKVGYREAPRRYSRGAGERVSSRQFQRARSTLDGVELEANQLCPEPSLDLPGDPEGRRAVLENGPEVPDPSPEEVEAFIKRAPERSQRDLRGSQPGPRIPAAHRP